MSQGSTAGAYDVVIPEGLIAEGQFLADNTALVDNGVVAEGIWNKYFTLRPNGAVLVTKSGQVFMCTLAASVSPATLSAVCEGYGQSVVVASPDTSGNWSLKQNVTPLVALHSK